jgi:chorismate-pyruvate lyase
MGAPSLPVRMLLTTDGSVTALLEAGFGSRVAVETVANRVDGGVLRRRAILRVADTGRPLLRARAVLAIDHLEGPARDALLDGDEPIGAILRDAALETRRELLPYTVDTATADDAEELGIERGATVFERSYRILSSGRSLADVTERIPATIFEAAA